MKVLVLTDFFYPRYGGVAAHVHGLTRALKLYYNDIKPVILTSAGNRKEVASFDGIPVIRFPYSIETTLMFNLERVTRELKYIISEIKPDLMHVHHAFSPMGISIPWISKSLKIPAILTNHSIPMGYYITRKVWYGLGRFLRTYSYLKSLRHYKHVIAVSHLAADFISKFYHGKITIIPNAIFTDEFNVNVDRRDLGISDDEYVILMVGRASIKKGFELAIISMRRIVKALPNVHLYIIGLTGWQKNMVEKMAKLMKLENNIHVLGYVPRSELIKYYKAADIFLHTAYGGESFGIVLLEAMASGTPIVATSGDGLKHVLEKSGAGVCLDYPSPSMISEVVLRILMNDELRRKMSINALKYVKRYSWKIIIKDIVRIYSEVL